ncbi:short-chain dehydrogenase [Flammula alnicola]|nr:short-chain dehydrogenase [Flammula alnicola]
MQFTFRQFWKEQRNPVPPVAKADLSQKTVIVTGANAGIGFEAAKHFALMNPEKLILACRSRQRGEEALTKLKEQTNYKGAELWILDLANFSSVKSFAEKFEKEGGRLDILVENAAIIPPPKVELSAEGWEPTFQINNLSTSLLAFLLLPRMLETSKDYNTTPRLVVVSSEVHYWTKIDPKVIDAAHPFQLFGGSLEYLTPSVIRSRYSDTKLLNLFFARALNDRLQGQSLIVNAVNPGFCYSSLSSSLKGPMAVADWIMKKVLARTSEEGSRQLIWAAVGGEEMEDQLRGAFISLGRVSEASDYVLSKVGQAAQEKLWDDLIVELVKVEPMVRRIVDEQLVAKVKT